MTLIPRTDLYVYPLNLGGNSLGWTSSREESFAVLDAFARAGGNFIDTADQYSFWADGHSGGESETVIGEWMTARGNRADIAIATKVGGLPSRAGLSAENVEAALAESLERLQTDYIDLYYAHFDDQDVPIADQVRTGHALVESGRVRHLALSNYSPERMREWFETATRENLTVPVAIQPHYNLVHRREYEQEYAPLAREFDVAVFPYFALASGFLTGKYRTEQDFEGTARKRMAAGHLSADGLRVVDALVEIAHSRTTESGTGSAAGSAAGFATEPATVALAWLLAKGVTAPIASARTTEQLPALLAATELVLSPDEIAALDAASAPFA